MDIFTMTDQVKVHAHVATGSLDMPRGHGL